MANLYSWPTGLPAPTLSSANGTADFGYESSGMQSGIVRHRQKFENLPYQRSVELPLTTYEVARVVDFLRRLRGAKFDMPLLVPGDPDNPRPTVSAQFMGRFRAKADSASRGIYTFDVYVEALPEAADGAFD